MSGESIPTEGKQVQRHGGAKGQGDRELRGIQLAREGAPRGPLRASERPKRMSDYRDAPASTSPREETEGALP